MSKGLYLYFLVINSKVHFIASKEKAEDELSTYVDTLNSEFLLNPNWEAVGVCVHLHYRADLKVSQAFVPGDVLYNQKMGMKTHIKEIVKESFPISSFEWVELPNLRQFGSLQSYVTLGRSNEGFWEPKRVPLDRAVFASQQRKADPQNRGRPGGPCQVLDEITKSPLDPFKKQDLVKDIQRGEDLDNIDAAQIYEKEIVSFEGKIIDNIGLTNHGQYRMDLRGITLDSIKSAFDEFERWFSWRKKNQRGMDNKEEQILKDLASGKTARFDADREGLTLIFTMPRPGKARLISTYWTGRSDPAPPSPGECDHIFKPNKRGNLMKKQLEDISTELMYASSKLEEKTACGETPCSSCQAKDTFPEDSIDQLILDAFPPAETEHTVFEGDEGDKEDDPDWLEGPEELEIEFEHDHSVNIDTGGGDIYFFGDNADYWPAEDNTDQHADHGQSHDHAVAYARDHDFDYQDDFDFGLDFDFLDQGTEFQDTEEDLTDDYDQGHGHGGAWDTHWHW